MEPVVSFLVRLQLCWLVLPFWWWKCHYWTWMLTAAQHEQSVLFSKQYRHTTRNTRSPFTNQSHAAQLDSTRTAAPQQPRTVRLRGSHPMASPVLMKWLGRFHFLSGVQLEKHGTQTKLETEGVQWRQLHNYDLLSRTRRRRRSGLAPSVQWLCYGLDDRGSISGRDRDFFFSSPPRPDRLWGPHNLLANANRGLFPRGWGERGVKLTTQLGV